jgi:hypothetical protein
MLLMAVHPLPLCVAIGRGSMHMMLVTSPMQQQLKMIFGMRSRVSSCTIVLGHAFTCQVCHGQSYMLCLHSVHAWGDEDCWAGLLDHGHQAEHHRFIGL